MDLLPVQGAMEPTDSSTATAAVRRKSADSVEKMITEMDATTEDMCEASRLFLWEKIIESAFTDA